MANPLKRAGSKLHNAAIPNERNNFKAQILHPKGLLYIKVGLIILQVFLQVALLTPTPLKGVLGYAANISREEVIRLTNQKRAENGLPPLKENETLDAQAQEKGKHMLEYDYWAHVGPDGTEPWFFFKQGGYQYRYAGENLARDFSDATSAVDAWMASPSHRENILSEKYKDIGIGVIDGDLGGVDTTIIVQFLGTRIADTTPPEPLAEKPAADAIALVTSNPSESPKPAEIAGTNRSTISPFLTTKTVSLAVVGVLLSVFAVDFVVISRKHVARPGGKVFAHGAFMGMVLTIILILKGGKVL